MNRPVRKNEDLHGNAPDSCPVVLLLVDVLNDVDFPGNPQLLKSINSLGKNMSGLKPRCKEAGIPAIYVNDNRGKWRSDFSAVLSHCLRPDSPGCPMVSHVCILSTAMELYVRDLDIYVPSDCVAAPIKRAHR
jgi:isochorismate hydrolase